ncbi:hypothetical protein K523DRAFT_302530 [Schizophyllum commune Tattone D]|nr:hypothetical protein K523DRAFT_302530 [Schizophyllum commune Tattone D]
MTWRHEPGDNEEALSLVFHRSTVLRHVDRGERVVPWKDWGPERARWLCMSKMSYTYITTTSGQRYVQKPATVQHTPDQPIHVLDFNPHTVRRVEAQLVQQGKEAEGRNRAREVMLDTPTATITLSADREPGRRSSTNQRTDYTTPWNSWPDDAFGRFCNPPEVISNANLIFADAGALEPGLPFVRTISKQKFHIVAVVMDNERIIGMSTDWVANTTILHPFYFG